MDSLYHQQALDESRQLLSVLTYEALRGFPRVMSELANFVVDPRSDGLTVVVPLGQFLAQEHQPLSPLEGLVVGSFGIIGHVPPILPPLLVQTGGSGSGVAPAGKNSRSAGTGGLRDGEQSPLSRPGVLRAGGPSRGGRASLSRDALEAIRNAWRVG